MEPKLESESNLPPPGLIKMLFLTNDCRVGRLAESLAIERLFVDLEFEGKAERQAKLDAHLANHSIDDVRAMRECAPNTELLVRCNPISSRSKSEIDQIVAAGADVVMLPMFRTVDEAARFVQLVGDRAKTCLLVETPQAFARLRQILQPPARPDEVHLGLNDLSLGLELKFLFEPLAGGLVDHFCQEAAQAGVPYGFGGVGALGHGEVDPRLILSEHVRLGSTRVILSRQFRKFALDDLDQETGCQLQVELGRLRDVESALRLEDPNRLEANRLQMIEQVQMAVARRA